LLEVMQVNRLFFFLTSQHRLDENDFSAAWKGSNQGEGNDRTDTFERR
jgi:hypothetical protein